MRKKNEEFEEHVVLEDSIKDYDPASDIIDENEIRDLKWKKEHFMDDRLITLIKGFIKKYKFPPKIHFDVRICGYKDEDETEINIDEPFICCHYYSEDDDYFYLDGNYGSSVYPWLNHIVEDYKLVIANLPDTGELFEVWLFVKLAWINKNPFK